MTVCFFCSRAGDDVRWMKLPALVGGDELYAHIDCAEAWVERYLEAPPEQRQGEPDAARADAGHP